MDVTERVSWVFRHIGPPTTIPEKVDVVALKEGAVTFGRGGAADVYIDSIKLKNFISRRHAVIVGEKSSNGQLHFVLHNYGLNGTYVNDVRIGERLSLQDGDRVIFGHKNGFLVKIGETAEQPDSEFQFVFERLQATKSSMPPLQDGQCDFPGLASSKSPGQQNGPALDVETGRPTVRTSAKRPKTTDFKDTRDDRLPSACVPEVGRSKSRKSRLTNDVLASRRSVRNGCEGDKGLHAVSEKKNHSSRRRQFENERESRRLPSRRHSDDGPPPPSHQNAGRQLCANVARALSLSPRSKTSTVSPSVNLFPTMEGCPLSLQTAPGGGGRKSLLCSERQISRSELDSSLQFPKEQRKMKSSSSSSKRGLGNDDVFLSGQKSDKAVSMLHRNRVEEKDRSRSPISRSISPTARSRSPTSKSRSPFSRSPNTRSRSPDGKECSSFPQDLDRKPVSPCRQDAMPYLLYDEPPVLVPEYVRTPSLVMRTPSPSVYIDKMHDDECDCECEDRERGREEKHIILCGVPPTPGHGFSELSPNTLSGSLSGSPHRVTRDVTPPLKSSRGIVVSMGEECRPECDTERRDSSNDHETSQHLKIREVFVEKRKSDVGKKQSVSDKKQLSEGSVQKDRVKPSFTSSVKEESMSLFSINKVKKKSRQDNKVMSEHKVKGDAVQGDHKISSRATPDSLSQQREKTVVAEKTSGSSETVDKQRLSSEHSSSRLLDNHTRKKRGHSSDSEVSGDEPPDSSSRPKAARLHSKLSKSLVEKENGLYTDYEHPAGHKDKDTAAKVMLKDVRVKLQRVTSDNVTSVRLPGENHRQHVRLKSTTDDGGTQKKDRSRMAGSTSETHRPNCNQEKGKSKSQTDTSLFGLQMEKLGSIPQDEKSRGTGKRAPHKTEKTASNLHMKDKQRKSEKEKERSSEKSKERKSEKEKEQSSEKSKERKSEKEKEQSSEKGKEWKSEKNKERNSEKQKGLKSEEGKVRKSETEKEGSRRSMDKKTADKKAEREKSKPRGAHKERKEKGDSSPPRTSLHQSESERDKWKAMQKVATRKSMQRKGPEVGSQDRSSDRHSNDSDDNEGRERKAAQLPRKRKKRGRKKRDADGDGEEGKKDESLEDGVMWYEEETCESHFCQRPAERRVQWVCCDDCDKWYHTECVGIFNFEDLKDTDYHCGCI